MSQLHAVRLVAGVVIGLGLFGEMAGPRAAAADDAAAEKVDFVQQIRPLLAASCFECHGPETRESGLRLDRKEAALAGGDSGTVIVPGEPEESVLIELISGDDPDRVMPPTGETLGSAEIELFKRWIAEGAHWPEGADGEEEPPSHWSFQPLRIVAPPTATGTIHNPIDAFVQARLARDGIAPAQEADRHTLIKRLYYDLLGLPPAPDAVDMFVNDASPTAYESLVDELLDSPHFGERWGRHWLDKARYADSDGYEKDRPRYFAWKYRDWVINAINADLPFDQFTVEQLAGDLLDSATPSQLVATGFHRQTLTNTEGGTDQEEFRVEAVFDRVETIGSVWLGLTVGCARCHSHKYDSISQREYYQLFAFFNNGDEANIPMPTSDADWERYQRAHANWSARLAELEQPLKNRRAALQPAYEEWLSRVSTQVQSATEAIAGLTAVDVATESNAKLARQADDSWLVSGPRPGQDVYTLTYRLSPNSDSAANPIAAFRLDLLTDPALPQQGPGRADNGNYVLSELTVDVGTVDGEARRVAFASATADHSQKDFEIAKAIDGVEDTYGWAIGPQQGKPHWAVFRLAEPIRASDADLTVAVRLSQQYSQAGQTPHLLGRFRLTPLTAEQLAAESLPEAVRAALAVPTAKRDAKQQALLFDHFGGMDDEFKQLRTAVERHRQDSPFKPEFPVSVIEERTKDRRQTHVFRRGSFLEPLGKVSPGSLEVLPRLPRPEGRELTRLEFAQWVVSAENPLTPRVIVNQFWTHLFGVGLVKTTTDFGVRGEAPSHPELLDWLAGEFIRLGWSRKQLLRTILVSHTYRQSSVHRSELVQFDPENRLLARQNRFRVEGEIVRDLYLAASGLLQPRIGGPSVFPQLPPGIEELSYANNFKWGQSDWNSREDNPHGVPPEEDVYRRGMYTFFKRTAAHPNLMTFDCPDSNTACISRKTSNTPLQALQTLNNPTFVDATRAMALRILRAGIDSDVERTRFLFRLCLCRGPSEREIGMLMRLLDDASYAYAADAAAAKAICGDRHEVDIDAQEMAAWITLARVVINLDEFLTRE